MKEIELKDNTLIEKLCERTIDVEEFQKQTSFKANFEQLIYLLEKNKDNKLSKHFNQTFHTLFWELPKQLSDDEELAIFRQFLIEHYHHEHEHIVSAFQTHFNKNKDNLEFLLKAIQNIPPYFEGLSRKSYIKKIIYAIAAHPNPYCQHTLKKLTQSENKAIKNLAQAQLTKNKET